jgi:hypothetical protein
MSRTGAAEDQARPAEPRKNRIGIGKVVVISVGGGLAALARQSLAQRNSLNWEVGLVGSTVGSSS